MEKLLLTLIMIVTPVFSDASTGPDEGKIFYHLHQATQWAQLKYSSQCPFSNVEIRMHLGKIKYAHKRLVDSKFYNDFLFLNKLSTNQSLGDSRKIQKLENKISKMASKLNLKLPQNWKDEFFICSNSGSL